MTPKFIAMIRTKDTKLCYINTLKITYMHSYTPTTGTYKGEEGVIIQTDFDEEFFSAGITIREIKDLINKVN